MPRNRMFTGGLKDLAIFGFALLMIAYGAMILYKSFTGPQCFIYWGGRHSPQVWKLWEDDFLFCTAASIFHVVWEVIWIFGAYYWATHDDE